MASADYFPSHLVLVPSRRARWGGRFASRNKIVAAAILRFASAAVASLGGAGPVRPPLFVAMKAAMGAADPTKGKPHDDRSRRHQLRAAARHIPDRPRPERVAASRLSPLPGRARPEADARSPHHRWRRRRHLRRPRRDLERYPPRTRPRGSAVVDRQSLPPRQ